MSLNFNRTAGSQKQHEVEFMRTSDLNPGKNFFILLCGDISTNLPDALGNIPTNYQGDDLRQHKTVVYWNDTERKFVEWIYTGIDPNEDDDAKNDYVDPLYNLGLDNTRPMGKQSFGSKNPQPELFVPVLTGVQAVDNGFTLSNLAIRVFRIKGQHQINGMLAALNVIKQRDVVIGKGTNAKIIEENSGVGRVLVINKVDNKGKTEYKFSVDEAPALNIGAWAEDGVKAANAFIDNEVKRIDIWATPEVISLASNGNEAEAVKLAIYLVREHFITRVGGELPKAEDVGRDQWAKNIEKIWPEMVRRYYIGAAKPLQVGEPTKILSGNIETEEDGQLF